MKNTIGVITIGQTPRVDLIPEIKRFFSEGTNLIEKGVLDNKSEEEIKSLAPDDGQTTLVSRLRDGSRTIISKEKILPLIQVIINELNFLKVDVIILACTGSFPNFKSHATLIYPDFLLNHAVKGLVIDGNIGVIMPLKEQEMTIINKWKEVGLHAIAAPASPYDFKELDLIEALKALDQHSIKAVILDCIGYTEKMKGIVQRNTKKPVILSRNIVFNLTSELL